ncbi:CHAT domain-containing protein, partial [Crocosphaera watsonii]
CPTTYSKALNSYNEARVVFSNLKDSLGVGMSFNNIGEIYRILGNYSLALTYYEKALIPFQQLNESLFKAATLSNIGTVYNDLGQYSTALNFYNKALVIQQEMTDKQGEGTTLHNLGYAYDKLEQNSTAQEYYQKALIVRRQTKDNQGEALTLNNLGLLYNELGQHSQALDSLEKALKTFKELGDIPNEGNTLDSLGTVYKSLGQYNKALEYYQQALSIQQDIGNRTGEGIVLTNIGDLYQQQGNNSQAISLYQKAIDDVIETIFVDLRGEELQSSFANKHADTYARLINLLWDEGRYQEAFDYVERAKARSFLNQIANRPRDFRIDADVNLLKQEQKLRDEINILNNQLIALNSSIISEKTTEEIQQQLQNKVANLKSTLTNRQQDYSKLLQQIKRNNPETADLVTVNPAKLEEIQSLLDKDTTLVEYFVTEDRILAFIVTHKTLIPVTLLVSKKDLQTTIDTLYEYEFATLENAHPHSLKQLHQNLISPLQPYLSTSKIAIVPHNLLHYIPFAALTNGENYLSDDYALFNLPSASIMRFLEQKRKPQSGTLMALGNPTFDLPFAKQEVETISAMYGNEPLTGQKANENILWSQAAQTGILHLATHGEYNPISPLFSTLYFVPGDGYDGRLETHEIYGLNLQAATNLVVLSACQTQIGKVSDGDEVVGLNRAFLYAGTPSVVASLWNVDDESTSLLMQQFYGYLRAGKSKAEALKLAQQDTRRKYPHPYYWAGFVLTGDSGKLIAD